MARVAVQYLLSKKSRNHIVFTSVFAKGCIPSCLCPGSIIGFPSMVWASMRATLGPGLSPCFWDMLLCKQYHARSTVPHGFCYPQPSFLGRGYKSIHRHSCSSNISAVLVIKGMYFPIPLQRSPEKQLLATAHPSPVAGGTCLGVLEHKAFLLPLYFLNCPWCAFNFF